jgi:riboflavin synthase
MFTGIVEGRGTVLEVSTMGDITRIVVDVPNADGLQRGASVSIDGTCLTAVDIDGRRVHFDVIPETIARTILTEARVGTEVNVERALRFGDEVGGHLVSGHVMGVGIIAEAHDLDGGRNLRIACQANVLRYVHEKGYIAVSGISLTVGRREVDGFWLHLIPETLERTTLGTATTGGLVNLEVDPLTMAAVDTVERLLAERGEA